MNKLQMLAKTKGKLVNGNLTRVDISTQELLELAESNVIIPYEKNRGGVRLNRQVIKSIQYNYNPDCIGVIHVEDLHNGQFKLCDAHHRLIGMRLRFRNNGFKKSELDSIIEIKIAPDSKTGHELYAKLNCSRGHTTRNKILNDDLGMGEIIQKVLDKAKIEKNNISSAYCNQIAYAIVFLAEKDIKATSYRDLKRDRRKMAPLVGLTPNELAEVFKFSQEKEKTLANALNYVVEIYKKFEELNMHELKLGKPVMDATAKQIKNNASLFGYFLWDKASGRNQVTYLDAHTIAKRMTLKNNWVKSASEQFRIDCDMASGRIVELLTTKKRS